MMTYYDLTIPLRSLVIFMLFLELCCSGCLLVTAWQRKTLFPKLMLTLCAIVTGYFMIVYIAEARARLRELEVPSISLWLCAQPIWLPLTVLFAIMVYLIFVLLRELRYHRNSITRSSIQEGINKLTSGLCFYQDGGRVTLVNHRMLQLCHEIVGRDLQNAVLFWEILSSGQVSDGVTRLSEGSCPSFRLPDGKVWTFAYEDLNGIHQLTAAETTQIQAVTDELKEKNLQLAALNHRLRMYGENVDELTRSKERLETKTRIHGELGQALLSTRRASGMMELWQRSIAMLRKERLETKTRIHGDLGQALLSTRRYLLDEDLEASGMMELWQRSIAMLRKEAQLMDEDQPMEMLARIASHTGITTHFNGKIPEDKETQKLFVQAAAEALTNAISHARAKTLYIQFGSDDHCDTAEFTNDGIRPECPITEGGGLSSLRSKIEAQGGTMTVTGTPDFVLRVTLPKTGGDLYV